MDRKIISANAKNAVQKAVDALKQGGLVIIPTDTVYGIAANARIAVSVEHLFNAKKRDRNNPITLLAASLSDVENYGAIFGKIEKSLAERFWPGPLTLVLKVNPNIARVPKNSRNIQVYNMFEGFRVPNHKLAQKILMKSGGILRVTSANLSGEPPALTADKAVDYLGEFADIVIDAGKVSGGVHRTVIKIENGKINILRQGAISIKRL